MGEIMNIVVIYDSLYGNTEKIAQAIGRGLSENGDARVILAEKAGDVYVRSLSVLVVGSPTHGGRPTPAIQKFLDGIEENGAESLHFASFDTRFSYNDQSMGLRFIMRMAGYAADKIETKLISKGGKTLTYAMGFIVEEKEGPLRNGEADRAEKWGREILQKYYGRSEEEVAA